MKEQPGGQNQWLNCLSLDDHYLQTLFSTLERMSNRTELTNVSRPARKLHHCSNRLRTFLNATARTEYSQETRNPEIRVTNPPPPLTRTTFQQQETSAVQNRNWSQSPINNSRNRSAESRNRSTLNQTTPQVIHQPVSSSGASGLPKLKLTEFSGDPLEWPEWSGLFDVVVHQKPITDTEMMQYLKTNLTSQTNAAISRRGFSSQSYYHAWDILCEMYGQSDVIVNAHFKKIDTNPPVWHEDSTSTVKFANVVTNVVNTLTQLGYTSDLEAEAGLSSTTRKFSPQLRAVVAVYAR